MSQAVTCTHCYSQMYENRKCVLSTDDIEYSQVLTSPVTVFGVSFKYYILFIRDPIHDI